MWPARVCDYETPAQRIGQPALGVQVDRAVWSLPHLEVHRGPPAGEAQRIVQNFGNFFDARFNPPVGDKDIVTVRGHLDSIDEYAVRRQKDHCRLARNSTSAAVSCGGS